MCEFTEKDFSNVKQIGDGAFGTTFKAEMKSFGTVAVKIFRLNENVENADFLKKLRHPNIVPIFGSIKCDNSFAPRSGYVMKFFKQGTVYDAIYTDKWQYNLEMAYSWCLQVAKAVAYLHINDIIHRNIRPANMFLSKSFKTVFLSNFGVTKLETARNVTASFPECTYMAPESIMNPEECGTSSDVFSYAVSAWEIITKRHPYDFDSESDNTFSLPQKIIKGLRPLLEEIADVEISKLLKESWNADPGNRPKMKNIVIVFEKKEKLLKGKDVTKQSKNIEELSSNSTIAELIMGNNFLNKSCKVPETMTQKFFKRDWNYGGSDHLNQWKSDSYLKEDFQRLHQLKEQIQEERDRQRENERSREEIEAQIEAELMEELRRMEEEMRLIEEEAQIKNDLITERKRERL